MIQIKQQTAVEMLQILANYIIEIQSVHAAYESDPDLSAAHVHEINRIKAMIAELRDAIKTK